MEIIAPRPLERKAVRLTCGFVVGAFPKTEHLGRAKLVAAEQFIRDMEKQGWAWQGGKFHLSGPTPAMKKLDYGSRKAQTGNPLDYVEDRPPLTACEAWMYFISGVFTRPMTQTQVLVDDKEPVGYRPGVLPPQPEQVRRRIA